jgi:hypothetical protein
MRNKTLCLAGLAITIIHFAGYGQTPPPPPPQAPPPQVEITKITTPSKVKQQKETDQFYKRNPSVKQISREGNITTVTTKDGRQETYNFDNEEEVKAFTTKYGTPPFPPPPPPPMPPPPPKQKTKS